MIEFELIDKDGNLKEKKIESNYLINASMRDKIVYNCIITGEKTYRSIDSISRLKKHSLKKIDLTDDTLFMNKEHSRKERMIRDYGVENNFQRQEIKEKSKRTNLEKYGVSNFTKTDEYVIKSKETKLVKYGDPNFNNREKAKETNLEKYGFEHHSSNKEVLQRMKVSISKKGLSSKKEILKKNNIEFLNIEDYVGQRVSDEDVVYDFRCLKCQSIFKDTLHSKIPRCPECFPKYRSVSEIEIENFIKENGFYTISSSRKIIPPHEIDIYVPDKKFAIELNGLYWHSEKVGRKTKDYHLNKTLACQEKGIQLIHIFEDEWIDKKEIVKSIIKNKLGIVDKKIYARKCEIKELKSKDVQVFYENNHIQGFVNSSVNIGLFYENEIVSVLSFSKSRFEKNVIEITRFANKLNLSVVGGFSKMFKYFIRNNDFEKISTYADRRYFDGSIYLNNNFAFKGYTKPSYYYIDNNYNSRYNRIRFQKHKLESLIENFSSKLTEWQNMQENGYDRIWDCGNYKFEFTRLY